MKQTYLIKKSESVTGITKVMSAKEADLDDVNHKALLLKEMIRLASLVDTNEIALTISRNMTPSMTVKASVMRITVSTSVQTHTFTVEPLEFVDEEDEEKSEGESENKPTPEATVIPTGRCADCGHGGNNHDVDEYYCKVCDDECEFVAEKEEMRV